MSRSLLRDVLKRNQEKGKAPETQTEKAAPTTSSFNPSSSRRSIKNLLLPGSSGKTISGSIRSSGAASLRSVASLAQSMASFYSMMTGGNRVPKRRRPDFSTLGVPEWYAEDPPPVPLMPGTAEHSPIPTLYARGMASVIHERSPGEKPYMGIVLYSHALSHSKAAVYHNGARIQGEVRLDITKKDSIKSVDVWLIIAAESILDIFAPPMYAFTANLWNREMGDPRQIGSSKPWRGPFPEGTFAFPFEFPELPKDVVVKHPNDGKRRNLARVPLPPAYFINQVAGFSGSIKYTVGVNIERDGLNGIDDELDMSFQYLPLCKPLPRVPTPFPFIPTREDWPFSRETVGGWMLTPFGGRGRLGEEIVEVEGILGVQDPPVYTTDDTIRFSLLLWSKNPLALEALGQPAAVEVAFLKSDMFALDVMTPRTSTRKNRYLGRLAAGRAWRTDDGRPDDNEPIPEFKLVTLPEPKPKTLPEGASYQVKGASSSRMKEVYVADETDLEVEAKLVEKQTEKLGLADDTKGLENGNAELVQKQSEELDLVDDGGSTMVADGESVTERAPSPTPSLDDIEEETTPEEDHFLRMDGEVKVPACTHPNFRYTHMGREYVVHLIFTHPQYNHISPNATGILAEFPVWYVFDRFGHHPPTPENVVQTPEDLAKLPVSGTAISVGPSTVRGPKVVGMATEEKRPTGKYTRYYAF
ncbi:hypothetical protein MIND_00167700 [Mycena indigotica]|uniref:Arrestin-like N-terminal domain-containing protein n=1 Tax=Mycena indigotica TaxID=2126181 RepID=A0A8H6WH08_9AGAR|nr:uncharacterized protein MIND_00167700 [Mycena indigotica]KAF7316486.1 hypothetical protein MIND_00167700 [Mycena indigotica]